MNDPLLEIGIVLLFAALSFYITVMLFIKTEKDEAIRKEHELKFYKAVNDTLTDIMALPFLIAQLLWSWIKGGKQ